MTGVKKWCVVWGDLRLSENDLTIGQAERIEQITGERWYTISPLRSAKHACAVATVMVGDALGKSEDEMAAEVRATRVSDFIDNIELEDDDTPPTHEDGNPPVAGTSTLTSQSSRKSRGAGRPPSSGNSRSGTSG